MRSCQCSSLYPVGSKNPSGQPAPAVDHSDLPRSEVRSPSSDPRRSPSCSGPHATRPRCQRYRLPTEGREIRSPASLTAAPAPPSATSPHHPEHQEIPTAACPSPNSGASILSAQTSTLIGAETSIKTIAAVHRQCRSWVIHVIVGAGKNRPLSALLR